MVPDQRMSPELFRFGHVSPSWLKKPRPRVGLAIVQWTLSASSPLHSQVGPNQGWDVSLTNSYIEPYTEET